MNYIKPSSQLRRDWFYWWLQEHWLISSGEHAGKPYRFMPNYPFMEGYAKDFRQNKVAKKCAQVGCSEIEIAEMFGLVDILPGNAMYVFPTESFAMQFSRARIKNAHLTNPYLENKLSGFDTLLQFKFKENYVYIRGSAMQARSGQMFRRSLISVDASRLFGDEVDEWEPKVHSSLQARLGASSDPIERYFSVPRLPDGGISKLFDKSDKREWAIRCRTCGEWNIGLTLQNNVTNFEYVDQEHKVICSKCHNDLDRLESDPQYAQWVAEKPDVEIGGYHFTKIFFRHSNIDSIVERYNDPETQQDCYNDDLGEPYEPKQYSITDKDLYACHPYRQKSDWDEVVKETRPISIGVDVGKRIHFIVLGIRKQKKVVLELGTVNEFDELRLPISSHMVRQCVIDAQPDYRASLAFCEEMQEYGTYKVAYFDQSSSQGKERVLYREDNQQESLIHIARDLAMSGVMFKILSRDFLFPFGASVMDDGEFFKQLKAPKRIYRQNKFNQNVATFPPSRVADHYYMALLYASVALELTTEEATFRQSRSA